MVEHLIAFVNVAEPERSLTLVVASCAHLCVCRRKLFGIEEICSSRLWALVEKPLHPLVFWTAAAIGVGTV